MQMFFVPIRQIPQVKPGDKFVKGDILSADEFFFKGGGNNTEMYKGTLIKVAFASTDITYEDSSAVTEALADRLTATIIMNMDYLLTKNANILKMVTVGTEVKTSDPLLVFEEMFTDDEDVGGVLDSLDDDGSFSELASNTMTSKYTGKIVDIRMYYNYNITEYSPSIQKVIKDYIKNNKERADRVKDAHDAQFVDLKNVEPIKSGRANGQVFDGLYIEFYVETKDKFTVGDKLTADTSLKSVVGEIIPNDVAPTSEFHPETPVDLVFSPISIVGRMTQDIFYIMYTNKVLIELKNKVRHILQS